MKIRTIETEIFRNVADLLATCDSREVNSWVWRPARERTDSHWMGENYEQARDLLEHGDADLVDALRPEHVAAAESIRPRRVNSVVGYKPNVPRSIIGLPRAMVNKQATRTASKVITLIIDVGYPACVSVEEIKRRGRELCEFIQGAELAGYRVGVDVCNITQRDNSPHCYISRLQIKAPEQALDIKRVCYPLIHASMLRAIFFDWYERYPNAEEVENYGTAFYAASEARRKTILGKLLRRGEIFVDANEDINDLQAALK